MISFYALLANVDTKAFTFYLQLISMHK